MNEAERCDRISLMHAGKVLDSDRPDALVAKRDAATLEQAFIECLIEAGAGEGESDTLPDGPTRAGPVPGPAPSARAGCSPICGGKPWSCSATRCAPPWRWLAPRC